MTDVEVLQQVIDVTVVEQSVDVTVVNQNIEVNQLENKIEVEVVDQDILVELVNAHITVTDKNWFFYFSQRSTEPTILFQDHLHEVWSYTLGDTTRYRQVPIPYDATQDAFYAMYEEGTLDNFITSRG